MGKKSEEGKKLVGGKEEVGGGKCLKADLPTLILTQSFSVCPYVLCNCSLRRKAIFSSKVVKLMKPLLPCRRWSQKLMLMMVE